MLFDKCEYLMRIGLLLLALFLPISIAATQFIWIFLMLVWLLKLISNGDWKFKPNFLNKPIGVFILLTIISVFFSLDRIHTLKGLKSESLVLIFFLIVNNVQNKKQVKQLILFFIIGSFIISLQGIISYFLGVNIVGDEIVSCPNFLVGAPEKFLRFISMSDGRITASRGHPLTLAEGLMFALSLGVPLAFIGSDKQKIWMSGQLLVIGVAFIFTFSRGPWIATFLVMLFIFICKPRSFRKAGLSLIIIILVIITISGSISLLMRSSRQSIVKRATNLWDQERIYMWQGGLNIIKHYPVWGVGLKNIAKVYPDYAVAEAKSTQNWGELHNNFIHIAAERGILTLILFLWIIISYFIYTFKFYWKIHSEISLSSVLILSCLSAFLGFIITGLTEYNFGDSEIVMMLWFVMGLTIVVMEDYGKQAMNS